MWLNPSVIHNRYTIQVTDLLLESPLLMIDLFNNIILFETKTLAHNIMNRWSVQYARLRIWVFRSVPTMGAIFITLIYTILPDLT